MARSRTFSIESQYNKTEKFHFCSVYGKKKTKEGGRRRERETERETERERETEGERERERRRESGALARADHGQTAVQSLTRGFSPEPLLIPFVEEPAQTERVSLCVCVCVCVSAVR